MKYNPDRYVAPPRVKLYRPDTLWYSDWNNIQALLNRQWPEWLSRNSAAYNSRRRWITAIRSYFVLGYSTPKLGRKLHISTEAARSLIRSIRRARLGRAARDGQVHTLKRGERGRDRQPRSPRQKTVPLFQ